MQALRPRFARIGFARSSTRFDGLRGAYPQPDRLGIDAWDVLRPADSLLPDHVRMAQLVRSSGSASAVLDLPELRDIDRHLAAYGAHARSELERVTSLLVELLSQDLTEEHAGL